jgi:hypothetical protein
VRVNSIVVGQIDTPGASSVITDELKKRAAQNIPMGRMGQSTDIAACALFLASPAASWITGRTIAVNGGADHPPLSFRSRRCASRCSERGTVDDRLDPAGQLAPAWTRTRELAADPRHRRDRRSRSSAASSGARARLVGAPARGADRLGINYAELAVLGMLRTSGPRQRRSPTELRALVGQSSAGMTRVLDKLEADGHLRR